MRRFLEDHPDYIKLEGNQYKDLLIWAHTQKLIELKRFRGETFYTKHDLDVALIWKEKLLNENAI